MPSAKAILIQTAAIVGVGAAVGLGDLLYRGDGVKTRADAPTTPLPPVEAAAPEQPAGQQSSNAANQQAPSPDGAGGATEGDSETTGQGAEAAGPATAIDCTSMDAPAGWPASHVTVARAAHLFQTGRAVFVDARIEADYIAGHIPNAHFLPVSAFESGFPDRVKFQMDPSAITIVYCSGAADCEAAEDVAIELQAAQFTAVYILHDGMPGWTECGHPVQEGEDPNAF